MTIHLTGILARHLEPVISQLLTEEPVVVLNGARTVGKSTLVQACAARHGVPVFDLDVPATREAVRLDPMLFASAPSPVCIDEFQHVLPILDAIKAELNRDLRPGRHLLTGSTRYATLPAASQSLTGRAHVITMWPMSQGELRGKRETFLDGLITDPASLVSPTVSSTSRLDYEQMVLGGGFPLALGRSTWESRRRWFGQFVNMVIERDVLEIRRIRQRQVLPDILRCLAAQTAQLLNGATIANAVGLDRGTVLDYIRLLESVFLVRRVEAYGRTLSARVNRMPKVHLTDSGLAAHLLNITESRLAARVPAVLSEFGHVLETFAVNEVLKQAGWAGHVFSFRHFRTKQDQEVDLVCEADDGAIAGIEVKGSSSVADADFRGLRLLRDTLGQAFVAGVVLYLGPHSYKKEDRLYALPLDRLWA